MEITNLLIPGLNDSEPGLSALASWMAERMGPEVPLHLSGYHPQYKMSVSATRSRVLEEARTICMRQLRYVYIGNVPTGEGQSTLCPDCRAVWIERAGYRVTLRSLRGDRCAQCSRRADIRL